MIFVVNVVKPPFPCPNFLNVHKRLHLGLILTPRVQIKRTCSIFFVVEWITKMDRTLFHSYILTLSNLTSFPKNLIIKRWVALTFYSISLSDNIWLGTLFLKCKIPFFSMPIISHYYFTPEPFLSFFKFTARYFHLIVISKRPLDYFGGRYFADFEIFLWLLGTIWPILTFLKRVNILSKLSFQWVCYEHLFIVFKNLMCW